MAWYDDWFGRDTAGGNLLSSFIGPAITGTLGYLGTQNTQDYQTQRDENQQQFESSQNQFNWQQRLQLAEKEAQQAAEIAAMQAETAKQALIQKAYSDAMNAVLQGGQLSQGALNSFISGVQAPYLRRPAA